MPIRFRCIHCKQLLGIAESRAGAKVDCPGCGRSVRVPAATGRPRSSKNARQERDPDLTDALSQLSALGSAPTPTASREPDLLPARQDDSAVKPTPVQPVMIASSESNLKPSPLRQPEVRNDDDDIPDAIRIDDGPWQESLREIAGDEPTELAGNAGGSSISPSSRMIIALAMLVGLLLGFGVARLFPSSSDAAGRAKQVVNPPPDAADQRAVVENSPAAMGTIAGTVTWTEPGRTAGPDSGSLVLLLPKERNGRWKLDGRPIRSATDSPEHKAVMAALQELGVSAQITDPDGAFRLTRLTDGPMTLVIISRHVSQPDEMLNAKAIDTLSHWFENPAQMTGRLAARTLDCPQQTTEDPEQSPLRVEFP